MTLNSDAEPIRCPSCGQSNRAGRRFCAQCGVRFDLVCTGCGEQNEDGERFCGQCGTPLEASVAPVSAAAAASTTAATRSTSIGPTEGAPGRVDPTSVSSGRYQIQRFLGEGAKKRVFLARDTRLERDVAIAIVKTEGLDDTGLDRVRREAEAMGKLGDHPNVVTVFDVEEERGQIFIVSRYVAGGDLEGQLRDAPDRHLPVSSALRIASDIARALELAHERGIIHRDVKPGNIWLAEDGTALLGDFGLAALKDRPGLTQDGTMLGTVAYMPPEQALGRSADARSDLYSLGATLYEALAGQPPFAGDDTVAVIAQHINSAPVRPSWHEKKIPRDLDDIVLRMLAKDPDERPTSAAEVAVALGAIATRLANATHSIVDSRSDETLTPATLGLFVSREREQEQLREVLARVLSGDSSVAMVVGEPGIGKTRLAKQFCVHAKLHGAHVLTGHCYEGEGSVPYQPFVAAMREHARSRDDADLLDELGPGAAELVNLVPDLMARFPDLPEAPRLEGEAERQRLFESMASFIGRAAQTAPIVLLLDDLHWADKPTLLLLLHLARRIRSDRVLFLGTYRDVELERTHPLAETVAALRTDGLYERVLLRGLTRDGVRDLLRARSGHEVPERLVERLLEETEGNPFFVEEVIKHLAEVGAIRREDGQWVGDPSVVDRSIPEGVREVIGHRLTRLSAPCNAMLTVASAMPGGFTFELLTPLCEAGEDALLDHLDEALRAQVIHERGDGAVYEFSHALIRQTLYQELSTPRRVRLHRQIGEALELLHGLESTTHLAEIAHHFFQGAPGGDIDKAVATSCRAAEHALGLLAWEDAAAHYERALEAFEMKSVAAASEHYELLFSLGEAQRMSGERTDSRKTLGQAAEIARTLDDSESFARAALAYASEDVTVQIDTPDVSAILEDGLEAIGERDSDLRVRLLSRLSISLIFSTQAERREVLAAEAVAIAQRLGDPAMLVRSSIIHGIVRNDPGDLPALLARLRETVEAADATGDAETMVSSAIPASIAQLHMGDGDGVDRVIDRYAKLADELRQPALLWFSASRQAMRAMCRGPMDEAQRLIEEAWQIGQRCQHPLAELFYGGQLGALERLMGNPGAGTKRMLSFYDRVPGLRIGSQRAPLLMSLGRDEEARAEYEESAKLHFSDIPRDGNWLGRMVSVVVACQWLSDKARARELLDQLRPYVDYSSYAGPSSLFHAPVPQLLGRLESLLDEHDAAIAHFEAAIAKLDRLRFGVPGAQCRLEFARALLARGGTDDRRRALEVTREALDAAETAGASAVVEQAVALQLKLRGAPMSGVKESVYLVADAVETSRPDLGAHAAPDGTVTLLFSDMEGFTAMTERLGDLRAREVIRTHNSVVREQLAQHGGYEVELQGDGFLLAFGSARQGLLCAIEIQRAFARYIQEDPNTPIRVRIGVHTGEAIKDADKFFGKTVILAARIAGSANGAEILASAIVRELTSSTGDISFGSEREEMLKGISTAQRIVEVDWR